jgi:ABC-2 type transport system ATP-binding protein
METAIEVHNLIKVYKGSTIPAVNSVSFSIKKGTFYGLLGPNGAGKTTIISILCGLLNPTAGTFSILGSSFANDRVKIQKSIGVVPQEIALYEMLTAYENLVYFGNMHGLSGAGLKDKIMKCLHIFGLEQSKDKLLKSFSGGMKRRVNLIAGILNDPQILFLDEPTVGIDVQSRAVITDFLKAINNAGTTVIYTSHLMEEAENLCSEIAIVDGGKIIAGGAPASLIATHNADNMEGLFLKLTGRTLRD